MQLSIELLPAPSLPHIARSPRARTSKAMSASALTPPKRRLMFCTSRTTSPERRAVIGRSRRAPDRLEGLGVDDLQGRGDLADATVLEADRGFDELLGLARIQRVDQHVIAFADEAAPDLRRARQLAVVGVELLVQDQEPADLAAGELVVGREVGIDLLHAVADELAHLLLLREVGVAAVGEVALLGPVAHRLQVDVDEGADLLAPVAEGH